MEIFFKIRLKFIFPIFILIGFTSCENESPKIKFVLAGHSYGHPLKKENGLYKPFYSYLKESNAQYTFLLGDFLRVADSINFKALFEDLHTLDQKFYFISGNHDISNAQLYLKKIGDRVYSFEEKDNKFICLDANVNGWNIQGDQLEFLKREINNFQGNVFIMTHQLVWNEEGACYYIPTNSNHLKADSLSFWSEVLPILEQNENEIFWCAGDIGAWKSVNNPFYYDLGNVKLIATGMGADYRDNCIEVTVDSDNQVSFEVISLQENLSFDDLEDMSPDCD